MNASRYAGRTALVTGASAGLGAEYARQLAAAGADLVLVARREERLAALAEELRGQGRRAQVIAADLSRPEAPGEVVSKMERHADILVNNAGFGLPGTYVNTSWEEQRDFIQLMVTACAHLAHAVLPGMHERGFGRIVNVASLAGIVPGSAGHTLYGASKAFLISMSQSLDAEARSVGVDVRAQACCPGFTVTEFHDVNGTREGMSKMPDYVWMQADAVVGGSLRALEGGPVTYVPGRVNKTVARAARLVGPEVAQRIFGKQSSMYRKTEGSGASAETAP